MDPIEEAAEKMAKALCEKLVENHLHVTIEPSRNHFARIDEFGVNLLKNALVKVAEIGLLVGKEPTNVDPGMIVPGVRGRITGQGLAEDEPINLDPSALIRR